MVGITIGTAILLVNTVAVLDVGRRAGKRLYPADRLYATGAMLAVSIGCAVGLLEILGTAGLLRPWPLLAATACLWLAGTRIRVPAGRRAEYVARWPASRAGAASLTFALCLVALLAAAIVDAAWHPRPEYDALDYHLPIAVQWLQAGNLRLLPLTLPNLHPMQFPANFELMELWILVPLHRDFLLQLAFLPGLALMVAGVTTLARTTGGRVRTGMIAALIVVTLPNVLVSQIGTDLADLFMAGALALAAGFLASYTAGGRRRSLVLAGLLAGLAAGARYQALVDIAPLAVIAVAHEARERSGSRLVRNLALALAGLVLTGGFFYVRNVLATGNPLFPRSWQLPFHHFPGAHNDACCSGPSWLALGWRPRLWWHTAVNISFHNQSPSVLHAWGPVLALLLAGSTVPVISALRGREHSFQRWTWSFYPLSQIACYLVTPLSAGYAASYAQNNARFLLVPAAAGAALLAAEAGRLSNKVRTRMECGALGLALACTLAFDSGVTRPPLPNAAVFLVPALLVLVILRSSRRVTLARRRTLATAAAVGLAIVLGAHGLQAHYARNEQSVPFEPVAATLPAADSRVDVIGICELAPFYGPAFDRKVLFLTGTTGHDPPLATTYSRWLAQIRAERVDAVVVRPVPQNCFGRQSLPEASWVTGHPDVFRRLRVIEGVAVYRLRPAASI